MISDLKDVERWIQIWYADDTSSSGNLEEIRIWFLKLLELGPAFGYFPEPSKSVIIVNESDVPAAQKLFEDIGI